MNLEKLTPFKWFVLQNFPFIEEDFDAITNYQLFCKLGNEINKVINNVNVMGTQVENLTEFVTNFFDNLDVQEEINNKLDEMVEDGTLAEIINDQIFGELNSRVTQNEGDISDLQTAMSTYQDIVTELTSRVTQNESDISDIETNITSLQTDVSRVEGEINPIGIFKNKNLVVFGDSFTDPVNNNSLNGYWVNSVAQTTGMTAFNYAKGAASLMRVSNSYRMQVNRAITEMTEEEKANTPIVIMYLPDTDILEDVNRDAYITEYVDLCTMIVNNFPNAKIIVATFTWRCNNLFHNYYEKMCDFIFQMKKWSTFPVIFLDKCMFWLLGVYGYYQNQYHPNQNGYMVIANKFVNAIYGGTDGDCIDYYNVDISNLDDVTDDRRCTVEVKNGLVNIEFYATFSVSKSNARDWIYLPKVAIPQPDIMTGLYTADGNFVGTARITKTDGKMQLYFTSVPADTTVFMTPLQFRAVANFDWE